MSQQIKLYSYYRSSCSYRVRIALYLKNIPFEYVPINLLKQGGEQKSKQYKKWNPEGQVPCLIHGNKVITQSMAILQYLEDIYPLPVLFSHHPVKKATIISICEIINSGIQPLQNLKVLQYLKANGMLSGSNQNRWPGFWIDKGLLSLEKKVAKNKESLFAVGNHLTAAELFIIPQLYNARRFGVNLKDFPRLLAIEELCKRLPAFKKSHPDEQPDSPLNSGRQQ
ncbi:MAG: maleylacetoacetate isomerase [Oligoflexia bacterium]|nr:maleylacetoacetate isomerase [Oligoflexia bacterium]